MGRFVSLSLKVGRGGRRDGAWAVGVVGLLTGLVLLVTACGAGEGATDGAGGKEPPVVFEVAEALQVKEGQEIYVEGFVFFQDDKVVMASALLESYPPLPEGPTLRVKDLPRQSVVGLSSTPNERGLTAATWSDFPIILRGELRNGTERVLRVTAAPRVVEAGADSLLLRFSPVSEPVRNGEPVWWAFEVVNRGEVAVVLTFSSSQKADVVLTRLGSEVYRWSSGKAFTEAIETVTLEPQGRLPLLLQDPLDIEAGDYELTAWVTASVRSAGVSMPLPELKATLTVH